MIEFIFGAIIIVIIIISLNPLLDNVEPFRLDFFLKRHLDNRPPASGLLLRLQITTKINAKMRVTNSAFTQQQQSQSNACTNNVKKSEKRVVSIHQKIKTANICLHCILISIICLFPCFVLQSSCSSFLLLICIYNLCLFLTTQVL